MLDPLNGVTLYRLPSFVTFSLTSLSPAQIQAQIDIQSTHLSVSPRLDDAMLVLEWTGTVIPKLVDTGLSLQLSGQNVMQIHLPDDKPLL